MLRTFSNIQVLKEFTTPRVVLKELLKVYLSKKEIGKFYFLKGVITGSTILLAVLQCDLTTPHIKRWS